MCGQSASVQLQGPESLTQQTGAALRTNMWHAGARHPLVTVIGAAARLIFRDFMSFFFLQKLFLSVSSKCGSDQVGGSFNLQSSLFKSQKKSKKVKKSHLKSKHVKKLTLSVICLFLNWLYDGSFSKFQRILF